MIWNKNVVPFDLATGITPDASEELPVITRGSTRYLTLNVLDNSMYDRYFKDDMLSVKVCDTCQDGQDALILLPDTSVVLRELHFEEDAVHLKPVCDEFFESETYPANAITILGVVTNVMRAC